VENLGRHSSSVGPISSPAARDGWSVLPGDVSGTSRMADVRRPPWRPRGVPDRMFGQLPAWAAGGIPIAAGLAVCLSCPWMSADAGCDVQAMAHTNETGHPAAFRRAEGSAGPGGRDVS
jgi:hypothetical protein